MLNFHSFLIDHFCHCHIILSASSLLYHFNKTDCLPFVAMSRLSVSVNIGYFMDYHHVAQN